MKLKDILSPREMEIVPLISKGMNNQAIADHLGLAEGTVKVYMSKIYTRLGTSRSPTSGRTDLALRYIAESCSKPVLELALFNLKNIREIGYNSNTSTVVESMLGIIRIAEQTIRELEALQNG